MGASRASLPCSTRRIAAVVVNSLVIDARSYMVSVAAGIGSARRVVSVANLELRPYAASMIRAPRWRTSTTPPGKTLRWIPRCMAESTAAARAGGVAAVDIGVGSGVCTAVGGGVGTDVGGGVGTGLGGFLGLTRGVAGTGVSATGVATLVGAEFGTVGAATQLASSVVAPPLSRHSTSRRLIRSL